MTDPLPFALNKDIQGLYRHYKGNMYRVLGSAKHTETMENFVVYQALYGSYEVWIRPELMFFGNVDVNGKMLPRFTKTDGGQQ
jgi:hypothetical protein